jgi:thymidylate kinase
LKPSASSSRRSKLAGVVAVIGCDGAGKSRLSADLVAHLHDVGPVEFLYLGQSSGNIATWIRSLPAIGPLFGRYLVRRAERTHSKAKSPDTAAAVVVFMLSLWRAHKFRRMLALHRRGVSVITDRYPQAEVQGFYFDGPGLDAELAESWFVRKLAERELRLYQSMAMHVPAMVIRLSIDVDTAHARKPDHKLSMLRDKVEIIPGLTFNNANILDLDGCEPYPRVLETALQAVGAILRTTPPQTRVPR